MLTSRFSPRWLHDGTIRTFRRRLDREAEIDVPRNDIVARSRRYHGSRAASRRRRGRRGGSRVDPYPLTPSSASRGSQHIGHVPRSRSCVAEVSSYRRIARHALPHRRHRLERLVGLRITSDGGPEREQQVEDARLRWGRRRSHRCGWWRRLVRLRSEGSGGGAGPLPDRRGATAAGAGSAAGLGRDYGTGRAQARAVLGCPTLSTNARMSFWSRGRGSCPRNRVRIDAVLGREQGATGETKVRRCPNPAGGRWRRDGSLGSGPGATGSRNRSSRRPTPPRRFLGRSSGEGPREQASGEDTRTCGAITASPCRLRGGSTGRAGRTLRRTGIRCPLVVEISE